MRSDLPSASQCSLVWKTGTIARPGQYSAVQAGRLNVVRPGRPEQCNDARAAQKGELKSQCSPVWKTGTIVEGVVRRRQVECCLNVVRSGRPEQFEALKAHIKGLTEVSM